MADQDRWQTRKEQQLWDIAEIITENHCKELAHRFNIDQKEIEEKFVILKSCFERDLDPLRLATEISALDSLPIETLERVLTYFPLGIKIQPKLLKVAKHLPKETWEDLIENALLEEGQKQEILLKFGSTRLMVIILLHSLSKPNVIQAIKTLSILASDVENALQILGVKNQSSKVYDTVTSIDLRTTIIGLSSLMGKKQIHYNFPNSLFRTLCKCII